MPPITADQPDELVKILQSSKGEKPLMIQVSSHINFFAGAYPRLGIHRPRHQ